MTTAKQLLIGGLFVFFLAFSFYPTVFELSHRQALTDPQREFILEHNYYWPDYNLYLSKIRQGYEGIWLPRERYTSEPHTGSLIQVFYTSLGHLGQILGTDPNFSYLLGRILLAPFLLWTIYKICSYFFSSYSWRLISFVITVVSGSFPKVVTNPDGSFHVIRYMEWWSNIDSLQRISFLPHILFGQIGSFYLFYRLTLKKDAHSSTVFLLMIILGNAVGIVFPPSLITLNSLLITLLLIDVIRKSMFSFHWQQRLLFVLCTIPSLLYLAFVTQQPPWSALVEFHKTHPMLIPFGEYILATGPIFFLALAGIITAYINRDKRLLSMILWTFITFLFAILFTVVQEQSPLRFTQTGLFIPLGILGSYFLFFIWRRISQQHTKTLLSGLFCAFLFFYIAENLWIMSNSLHWQTTWITQRLGANIPPVPYPPQAVYPLREWMEGIRWLRDHTNHDAVVLADITAGNYIPAYAGNTVYFGQANTVDYERKQQEVIRFFRGQMSEREAQLLLKNNHIQYIFYSIQEQEENEGKKLETLYNLFQPVYHNNRVTIYTVQ